MDEGFTWLSTMLCAGPQQDCGSASNHTDYHDRRSVCQWVADHRAEAAEQEGDAEEKVEELGRETARAQDLRTRLASLGGVL